MPEMAPYGSWKSPITAGLIVGGMIGLGGVSAEGDTLYWTESRPQEGGRSVIVRRAPDGTLTDLLPPPWNARTRVHEYGGTSYRVHQGGVYFSNFADQRLYRLAPGAADPQPLTPALDLRYAEYEPDARRGRLLCVREDHTDGGHVVTNTLVAVDMTGADVATGGTVLVEGSDFYSNPRLSPDGSRLAWLTWNHPNMPWDGTELWVADLDAAGRPANPRKVAGGPSESVFQPEWAADGRLYFVSDPGGWWNLYRWDGRQTESLHPMQAEFGEPQWSFGRHAYALDGQRLICKYTRQAVDYLAVLDTASLSFTPCDLPFTLINDVTVQQGRGVFIAASPSQPRAIVSLDLDSGKYSVIKRASGLQIDPGYVSTPLNIEFPTENGLSAFAFFYPPANRDYTAPAGELPPVVVNSHGGPTGATSAFFQLDIQFWTSRGIAVLDVNYGGSTGYGRTYRDRLKGQWGIMDMDDCVNGVRYLVDQGLVDPERLAIAGGSAGGYTTLCALAFRKVFKAGASYFGVSDAETLATDTHKFESRYLDSMIGPYPAAKEVYYARSPIHFVDQMQCALILFQGLDDKVVPPDQSRKMYEALRARGYPTTLVEYPGEGHGFRRAENIRHSLESELYFYSRVFGFTPADAIAPVKIDNLD